MTMFNLKGLLRRNKSVSAQAPGEAVYLPGYILPQALVRVCGQMRVELQWSERKQEALPCPMITD